MSLIERPWYRPGEPIEPEKPIEIHPVKNEQLRPRSWKPYIVGDPLMTPTERIAEHFVAKGFFEAFLPSNN
jgi:hypothetical protein